MGGERPVRQFAGALLQDPHLLDRVIPGLDDSLFGMALTYFGPHTGPVRESFGVALSSRSEISCSSGLS